MPVSGIRGTLSVGLKWLLDIGMVIMLILVVAIAVSGPVDYTVAGITLIKSSHLHSPLQKFFILLFIRLVISVEFKNLLLIIGSVVFSLAMIEITLRIWDAPITQGRFLQIHRASPVFAWDLEPGSAGYGALGEYYEINSAGFRDSRDLPAKDDDGYRIVAIGDSFTFGMGVDLEDSYPKQLETILASENIPAEVINAGIIGHNMWQHIEVLKNKVLPYRPDLIILGIFEDDLHESERPLRATVDGYQGNNPFSGKFAELHTNRFYLQNFLANVETLYEYKYRGYNRGTSYVRNIAKRKKLWGPENPTDFNYRIMTGKFEKQRYVEFAAVLGEFASAAREAGSEVLVVMIPDSVQLNEPDMQVVNRYVAAAASDHGLPFVDVTPFLEAQDDPGSLYLFPYDAHNSEKGQRLIAEAISARILALDLLPAKGNARATGQRN